MPKGRAFFFFLKKEIGWIQISDDHCPLVKRQTSNSRHRRSDIRYRTTHRCPMSDVWCPMSDVWCLISDVWCPMSDFWGPMSDIWCWCLISNVRCPISDVWCPISAVRCPMSDVRRTMYDFRCLMSDIGTRFLVLVGEPLVWRNLGVFIFSHSFMN